ncbi:MAG: response regulator [Okeania sp. SIO2H7]|nr:response regulator [Okeania sp. SIO2H7]
MSEIAILCVDDEEIVLESLKEQLKRKLGDDYLYETTESVEDAWEVIEELMSDEVKIIVIISDWLMPEQKGDEFLIEVHQKFPDIVKVMLTGQADESAIDRAQKHANLYACVHKPWTEEQLIKIVTSALEGVTNE